MKQTFQVKHAVGGRMFIDSNKGGAVYSVASEGAGWLFRIEVPWSESIAELLRCKEELNVFLFYEYGDRPTLKTWYYVKDGPVSYDAEAGVLTVYADSRIEYYPHQYST